MVSSGLFTGSDRSTIKRAGVLAETLTERYFHLPKDEWKRYPYGLLTRKEVGKTLYQADVFANVITFNNPAKADQGDGDDERNQARPIVLDHLRQLQRGVFG